MLLFTKCKSSKFFNTLSQKTYFFKKKFLFVVYLTENQWLKKITLKKNQKKKLFYHFVLFFCLSLQR